MKYRLSEAAVADIQQILDYSEREYGLRQALEYRAGMLKALRYLAANPLAVRERTELSPPVRVYPYGAHLIVYVTEDSGIRIVRVPHGRQDW